MKKLFLFVFAMAFIAVLALAAVVGFWATTPLRSAGAPIQYEVAEGSNLTRISGDLAKAHVIRWPELLRLYGRFDGRAGELKAGLYEFEAGLTPLDVYDKLVKGKVGS